jgi:hypothetical protein
MATTPRRGIPQHSVLYLGQPSGQMQEDQRRVRTFFLPTRFAFGWRNPEAYDADDGSAVDW